MLFIAQKNVQEKNMNEYEMMGGKKEMKINEDK